MAVSAARDTIDTLQSISDDQTIVSADETFAVGFFSPGTSKNRYVGIWYNKDPTRTVVWVANRDKPLTDSSGVLKVNNTGILVLLNHNKSVIWSSNTRRSAQKPFAKLLNSGNFIVQDKSNGDPEDFLWQSFDYPCDTHLPGQKLGRNLVTGLNRYLTSWNSSDDPSPGRYSFQLDIDGYPQFFLREGTVKRFRYGSWNGIQFSGTPQLDQGYMFTYNYVSSEEEISFTYALINGVDSYRVVLKPDGTIEGSEWSVEKMGWTGFAKLPVDDCDNYATCGAYASCNINNYPVCRCLDRFRFVQNKSALSSDCVRRTSLSCHGDGFLQYSGLKLPDTERSWFNRSISLDDCRMLCLKNCSCTAYAALDVSKGANGCLLWFGNLTDLKVMNPSFEDIYIRMAGSELGTNVNQFESFLSFAFCFFHFYYF